MVSREYEISACTKEAKKHMKEVHRTKGKPMWELKPEDIDPFFMDKTKGRLEK